jgi:hypothetical protein
MTRTPKRQNAELRDEYVFDYSESKPNRFASQMKDSIAVVLEPDVAAVFHDSKSVNTLLRSVIAALPREKKPRKRAATGSA